MKYRYPYVISVDFETYYSPADGYSLSRKDTTAEEYINDPRFQVILCTVIINGRKSWHSNRDPAAFADWLRSFPWDEAIAIAHNGCFFDFLILGWKYAIYPAFYMDTLLMARPLAGPKESSSLKNLARRLGLGEKGDEIERTAGMRLEDFTDDQLERYAAYGMQDSVLCLQLALVLVENWTANALAWMCITCRMGARPAFELDHDVILEGLAHEEKNARNRLSMLATQLTQFGWTPPLIEKGKLKGTPYTLDECIRKDALFCDMLEALGHDAPMKLSEKQRKMVPAFAKTDPVMRQAVEAGFEDGTFQAALEARLGVKSTALASRLERHRGISERMGWLPVSIQAFGAHCVPGETEVLTPHGWVPLERWSRGRIMQFDPHSGELHFAMATIFRGPVVADWIVPHGKNSHAPMTLGHRVPYRADSVYRTVRDMPAKELLERKAVHLLEAAPCKIVGATMWTKAARLLAMVHGVGNMKPERSGAPRSLRFALRKPARIERCREILRLNRIPFTETTQPTGTVCFRVEGEHIPEWLTDECMTYGPWLLNKLKDKARLPFVREAIFWSGSSRADGTEYYCSSVRQNVEWIATLAHLSNVSAGRVREEYAPRDGTTLFRVTLRMRKDCSLVTPSNFTLTKEPQRSWCTKTKTGFWLARYRGKIFITGNTGRNAGCLTGDTEITVYSDALGIHTKPLIEVLETDLVWDGEAFVAHDGVVFSGEREVITYDGISGTPDHMVFCEDGEKPLEQAASDSSYLRVAPLPPAHWWPDDIDRA